MADFSLNQQESGVNFIGNPRPKNHYIPGYLFRVKSAHDFESLKAALTQCMFEAQTKISKDKAEDFDAAYFAQ